MRGRRRHRSLLFLASMAGLLAGCGTGSAVTVGAAPSTTAPATTTTSAPVTTTTLPPPPSIEVCALLSDADLSPVFPTGPPPAGTDDYGEGFSDCSWDDGKGKVLVTVMPASNLRTDYVEQLNVTSKATGPGLGEDAVYFPGFVGLGKAASGGSSVGFTKGERGVIVAVRTADANDSAALQHATALAVLVAGRI